MVFFPFCFLGDLFFWLFRIGDGGEKNAFSSLLVFPVFFFFEPVVKGQN